MPFNICSVSDCHSHRAEENAKNSEENSTTNETWTDQLHLHGLEAAGALAKAKEGDEEAEGDHGQPHVQDHVRAPAAFDGSHRLSFLGWKHHLELGTTKICWRAKSTQTHTGKLL